MVDLNRLVLQAIGEPASIAVRIFPRRTDFLSFALLARTTQIMQILFKVTAHFGYGSNKTATYYVIATDSAKAEKQVKDHHRRKDYSSVDFCHTETVAQAGDYGKPHVLLHNEPEQECR